MNNKEFPNGWKDNFPEGFELLSDYDKEAFCGIYSPDFEEPVEKWKGFPYTKSEFAKFFKLISENKYFCELVMTDELNDWKGYEFPEGFNNLSDEDKESFCCIYTPDSEYPVESHEYYPYTKSEYIKFHQPRSTSETRIYSEEEILRMDPEEALIVPTMERVFSKHEERMKEWDKWIKENSTRKKYGK
jgi:hypothetical protein